MRSLRRLPRQGSVLLVLLVAFGALAIPAVAGPHDRLERIDAQKQRVQAKRAAKLARAGELADVVAGLDEKRVAAENALRQVERRLTKLDSEIVRVEARLTIAQQELTSLTEDLLDVQARLVRRTDFYAARAVAAYKAGPTAYADSLLSSESFSELVERYSYYESALDADSELVEEIEVLRDETELKRAEAEELKDGIALDRLSLVNHRSEVEILRGERASFLAERKKAVDDKQAVLAEVQADAARFKEIEEQLLREQQQIEALLAAQGSSSSGPLPVGGGQLLWPAAGPLTSTYGYRTHPIFGDERLHTGIDIGAPYGAPVIAADDGEVVYVGAQGGYGNVIAVDHGGGLATTYNHLSAFYVGVGQEVGRGSRIGAVGCTGYCTGPHLHFEVRVNGSPVDPLPYLQ